MVEGLLKFHVNIGEGEGGCSAPLEDIFLQITPS